MTAPGYNPTTGGGWCVHGVPYGPNWSCSQCGSTPKAYFSIAPRQIDEDRLFRALDRIVHLLEEIAGRRR